MALPSGKSLLLSIVLILQLVIFVWGEHRTIDAAKINKHLSAKKHWKKLKKQDGAIRLVGGRNEHEGTVQHLHDRNT